MAQSIDHNTVLRNSDRWRNSVPALTVSPKYQVVIPKEIRESKNIKPGKKVDRLVYDGKIVLVPLVPIEELRGIAKGIEDEFVREPDREL